MKNIILIIAVALGGLSALGQAKKPTPKPAPKPTPTTTAKPTVQPTPTPNKFSDYKIAQKFTAEGASSFEQTIYSKGVRERTEMKVSMPKSNNANEDEGTKKMMEAMMSSLPTRIKQCDLKQDVEVSDKKKAYFIDYYDWSGLSPEQLKRRPQNKPVVIKGTETVSSVVIDSGKRQQMFGLEARWLKHVTTFESSADSCDGKNESRMEVEGWFVRLRLDSESCPVERPKGATGGCRPKVIVKSMQNPGFLLEGTLTSFDKGRPASTAKIETLALSKATLDQALFEIPTNYTEVDSSAELMPGFNDMVDMSAKTVIGGRDEDGNVSGKTSNLKTIAIDFFSGNASKVNQDELRSYISTKVSSAGMSGFPINSQADLLTGKFVNVIGVELKKIKESGGAKIGGLFGKVTGNTDAAKLGDSEAEIVITIYGKDGKTSVASDTAIVKIKGSPNDAVKAAIDKIISGLLAKIK